MYTINIEIHVIIYMWQISCVKAHNLTACIQHQHNLLLLLVLSISWTDISVGLHPYDCQSKKKMLKHIIYIWSRSAMSIKIKWVGSPTHNLTACIEHNLLLLVSNTNTISYYCWFYQSHEQISVWGCILLTASQRRRCWNTLYTYEVDLLWI